MHAQTSGDPVPHPRGVGRLGRLGVLATSFVIAACSSGATASPPGATEPPASTSPTEAASEAPQLPEYPADDLTIMAPAAPGGGWDSTARAMQQAVTDAGLTSQNVEVYNVAGAGGTVGLAQFVEQEKGTPESLMVMGLVMVGAIRTNASPVDLSEVTPIASLTAEWEAIAVKADSKYQTLGDLVADFKSDPRSIAWGGGSAGGTDHILVGLIAKEAGVDPSGINYIAHSGGGEALDAILSGAVTAGVSGVSEFADQVAAGAMRYLAISSDAPVEGIEADTIQDAGIDVTLANWRGVVAPPDLEPLERDAAVAFIEKLHESAAWQAALEANGWTDFFQAGDSFVTYLDDEVVRVEGVLKDIGLIE
jgi:putative tricarboxylic transport membrane protein